MARVYRIRREETTSGIRYVVDYRDSTGRRTKRRFQKARDAEAFKRQIVASTYIGLPIPRPVSVTFAAWAAAWFAQKAALSHAGKKPVRSKYWNALFPRRLRPPPFTLRILNFSPI
jgi:hypothetical protein